MEPTSTNQWGSCLRKQREHLVGLELKDILVSLIYKWSLSPTNLYGLFILGLLYLMSNKGLGTIS